MSGLTSKIMGKEIAKIHGPINKSMVRKILVLTANPNDTNRLRADREMQGIQERLRRINQRSQFEIIFKCARPDTLLDVIEEFSLATTTYHCI